MKRTFTKLLALIGLALGATTANANHYWLRGECWADANGWSDKVTTLSGSKYVVYNVKTKQGNFGIKETPSNADATQLKWFASSAYDTNIVPGGTMDVKQDGTNWYIKSDYACTYTFVFTPTNSNLIAAPELYIIKEDGSWNLNSNEKLTYSVANNNYTGTFSINNASGGHFTLSAFTGDWDNKINKLRFSCDGDVTPSFTSSNTYSGTVTLGGRGAYKLPQGEYNVTLDLSTNKITIEKKVEEVVPPTPTYPETLYLMGTVNGQTWEPTAGTSATGENGVYSWSGVTVANGGGQFSFSQGLGNDWDSNVSNKDRFGPDNNGNDLTLAFTDNKATASIKTYAAPNDSKGTKAWIISTPGTYDIKVDLTTSTLTVNTISIVEPEPEVTGVYLLVGKSKAEDFSKIEKTDDCKFDVTEDSNISKLRYTFKEPGTYYLMVYDGGIKGSYDAGSDPVLDTTNDKNFLAPDGDQGKGAVLSLTINEPTTLFLLYYKEYYNGSKKRSCLFATAYPANRDQLHIFGHINNKYWDNKNYEIIKKTDFGVYRINNVDISGRWNQSDLDLDETNSRELNGDSGNENYIAFYVDLREDEPGYKLGATTENQLVYQNEKGELATSDSETYPLQYVYEDSPNNFHVAKGIYDIEIDLNKMTVTFKRHTDNVQLPAEFVWFQGQNTYDKNGKSDNGASALDDQNDLIIQPEENHILQVGIEDDPDHIVARQVTYTVWFKALTESDTDTQALLRRNAPSTEGYDVAEGVTIDENTTEEENADAIYFIYGSVAENENHLIKLNQPGNYIIAAALHEDASNVDNYQIPDPNYLKVEVKADNTPTGVEGIEAEAGGDAVYYNLQGVRVANPVPGEIYIKVAGGNSVKVIE